ncbi:MAG: 2-hydroxyacid dehydrogenase [Saprospiraceae bacterium]|nr:MAG: 2-hydroxyacid dehydrogenase [Saprospiraceae bacterium]
MSNKRKILFLDRAHPYLWEKLQSLGYDCQLDIESNYEGVTAKIHNYFGIVMRSRINIGPELLDQAKQLAFIAREGVGTEHIDVVYAENKDIQVITSPEGSRDTVGEHTLGLLLCLMNNLARADREVRAGKWIREGNRATEIKGKTVGVIGYGNMGMAFAQRLSGFECKVIAYDKFKTDYGDQYATAVDLETLFHESDIISLHIPYFSENKHLVNNAFLSRFRKNIYVVNTARGLVLDTEGLVKHLKSGKVLGAALDVLEYEESSFDFIQFDQMPDAFRYLTEASNVVLSPHIAGWSFESKEGHARVLGEKIERV